MMRTVFYGIASQVRYRPAKPVRDPEYRRFIKRFPCSVCGKSWGIDPCHTGPHGLSQRSSDMSCIPLCRVHHQEYDSGPREFVEKHHLDIPLLIEAFNMFYAQLKAKVA